MQKLLWETEFYAISVITGDLTIYRGTFIEAPTIQEAIRNARSRKFDYLQFTGEYFKNYESVLIKDLFHKRLEDPLQMMDMGYDEFMDWLDLANDLRDLEIARDTFERYPELDDYRKVIELQIKIRDNDSKKENDNQEED